MKKHLFFLPFLVFGCKATQQMTLSDLTPEHSFTTNCEGPNVDKAGNLFVVNYGKDGTVGIITPEGNASKWIDLPEGSTANAIRFDQKGDMLLADFTGHNILKINPVTKKTSIFCHDGRFNQPNDLCIHKSGAIFASDPNWDKSSGNLWRISPDGKATLLEENMGTTNGIELSPDGRILYVNESVQKNIWAYNVAPNGEVSNKRLFTKFDDFGLDGMKCDRKGNLYVARYGKGVIAVFSPKGKFMREIATKGKKTSNLAFANDGKTIFVTLQDRGCVEVFKI